MSVIVAKSTVCCSTSSSVTYDCFPAVSIQRIIPPGQTLTVDGIAAAGFLGAKWLVTVSNTTTTAVRSYELHATHINANVAHFARYGMLGLAVNHTPNVTAVGGVLNLTITNNETVDIIVYVTRLGLPINNQQNNVLDVVEVGNINAIIRLS